MGVGFQWQLWTSPQGDTWTGGQGGHNKLFGFYFEIFITQCQALMRNMKYLGETEKTDAEVDQWNKRFLKEKPPRFIKDKILD